MMGWLEFKFFGFLPLRQSIGMWLSFLLASEIPFRRLAVPEIIGFGRFWQHYPVNAPFLFLKVTSQFKGGTIQRGRKGDATTQHT